MASIKVNCRNAGIYGQKTVPHDEKLGTSQTNWEQQYEVNLG